MIVLHILLVVLLAFALFSIALIVAIAWTHYPRGIPIGREHRNENRRHQ